MNKPASSGRLVRIPCRLFDEPGVNADKAWRASMAVMKASQRLTEIAKSKPPKDTNDFHRAQLDRWISTLGTMRELLANDFGFLPSTYEEIEGLALILAEVKAGRLPEGIKPRATGEKGGGTNVNELGLSRRIMCAAALDVIKAEERAAGRETYTLGMAAKRVEDQLRKAGVTLAHFGIGMAPDDTGVARGPLTHATAIQIKDTWRSEALKKNADELAAFIALGEKLGSDELLLRASAGRTRWAEIAKCTDAIEISADAGTLVRE